MFQRVPPQLALLSCIVVLPVPAPAQTEPPAGPQVVTYGTGQILLPPDRAIIRIAVTTDDSTAATAAAAFNPW